MKKIMIIYLNIRTRRKRKRNFLKASFNYPVIQTRLDMKNGFLGGTSPTSLNLIGEYSWRTHPEVKVFSVPN